MFVSKGGQFLFSFLHWWQRVDKAEIWLHEWGHSGVKLASEVSEALPLNLESPVAPSSSEKTCSFGIFCFQLWLGVSLVCSFASVTHGEPACCDGEATVFWYEMLQHSAYSASVLNTYPLWDCDTEWILSSDLNLAYCIPCIRRWKFSTLSCDLGSLGSSHCLYQPFTGLLYPETVGHTDNRLNVQLRLLFIKLQLLCILFLSTVRVEVLKMICYT